MSRKSFWSCRSGNVGLLFALAIVPVVASIGLAIDYSMAAGARYRLQNAIDATALSLAHARTDLNDAQLQARADLVFAQNFASDDFTTLGTISVVRGTDYITVDASAQTKTTFSRVLGIDTFDIASNGKVVWGPVRVEVALALDNTFSMNSDNKMVELKKAAKSLVDILEEVESKPGDVKIGLVPFGEFVRVDSTELTPYDYKDDDQPVDWINFRSKTETTWVKKNCDRHGNDCDWVQEEVVTPFNKAIWKGCFEDRDKPYDTTDFFDIDTAASKYPAVDNVTCGSNENSTMDQTRLGTIRPLGWDFDAIRTAITNMVPVGSTNITIGVQWGMALLSHTAPFTQGVNPANENSEGKTQKVLIMLTDGTNTKNRFSNRRSEINARTELACAEAKKIATVYTIRVIAGDEDILKKCASKEDYYYNVQNASQLVPIFKAIGDEISKLRVSN